MTFLTLPSGASFSVSQELYDLLVWKEEEIARLKVELATADGWQAGAEAMRKEIKLEIERWADDPEDNRTVGEVVRDTPLPEMEP